MAKTDPGETDMAPQSPAEIAAQLDLDRAALAQSIEDLRHRMDPEMLRNDVLGFASASVTPYAQGIDRAVRANPLAAIVAGAGVAWLVLGRKAVAKPGHAYGTRQDAQPRPSAFAPHHVAQPVTGRFIEDQPLLAAGIGMAIGVAVGAAFPGTDIEDRLFGPDRDKLLAKARAALRQQKDEAEKTTTAVAATLAASLMSSLAASIASKLNRDAQNDSA